VPAGNAFRQVGGQWLLAFDGDAVRVADAKGLRYIAELLRQEGHEVHVADLAGVRLAPTGDSETLDRAARAAYRDRLDSLRDQLEEAEASNDPARASALRREMGLLADELGVSGHARSRDPAMERLRKAVGNRIRDQVVRLERVHPRLARHLTTTIRTGTFCSYRPETAVRWEL
jgi:hypothetical protein